MNYIERHSMVVDDLQSMAQSLNCTLSLIPPTEWSQVATMLQPAFRAGWVPPLWIDLDARVLVIPVCINEIVRLGEIFDDEDFEFYVAFLTTMICSHAASLEDIPDALERHAHIEEILQEASPDGLLVLSQAQFHALD